MNKIFLILILNLCLLVGVDAQSFKHKMIVDAEDSYISQFPAHSPFDNYLTKSKAVKNEIDTTFMVNLTEGWSFKSFSKDEKDNFSYLMKSFDAEGWTKIVFPSQADELIVTPSTKSIYHTKFYVSQHWDFRNVFLTTPMSQSSYDVYVNGTRIGTSRDTRNTPTFNITKNANEGYNSLVIVCKPEVNGSFLEDNSLVSTLLNGDVILTSTPRVIIEDYFVNTTFSNDYSIGNVQLDLNIHTFLLNQKESKLAFELYNQEGELITTDERWTKLKLRSSDLVSFYTSIENVILYSAANPYRYKAVVSLIHENRMTQITTIDIAFIEPKVIDFIFAVNSHKTGLYGVVWDEVKSVMNDEEYSEVVLKNLNKIKESGLNALLVLTPEREKFYELCDQVGLYVINSANVDITSSGNSRGINGSLANVPMMAKPITERVLLQLEKTKNNPTVFGLVATRTNSNGYALYEMYLDAKNNYPKFVVASTANDLEWNNDFLIHNNDTRSIKKLDNGRMNFVYTGSINSFDDLIKDVESGKIAGAFIKQSPLFDAVKDGKSYKSLVFTQIDTLNGRFGIEIKNKIIPQDDFTFSYSLINYNGEVLKTDVKTAIFENNKSSLSIDYKQYHQYIQTEKEIKKIKDIRKIKDLVKIRKYEILVEIRVGKTVIDKVRFDYKPVKVENEK